MHESAWGTGYIARKKHNLFGHNAFDRNPLRFATAFATYAASIDSTARFIKEAYLTPHGRWWGGRPTLRSMQQFWSSSHRWGIGVSRIATCDPSSFPGSSVDQIRRPGRRRSTQRPEPGLGPSDVDRRRHPGGGRLRRHLENDRARFGGRRRAPRAIPFRAGPGLLDAVTIRRGSASLSPVAPVSSAKKPTGPTSVAARRVRTEARAITIAVPAPREPGRYRLDVDLLDSGSRPLPAADKVDIPSVEVQVWSDRAVRYDLAPISTARESSSGSRTRGSSRSRLCQDRKSSASRDPDARMVRSVVTLTASANDPKNPLPVRLLETPLVTGPAAGCLGQLRRARDLGQTGRTTNRLSANLSVLSDPTWLEAHSPADAWFWGAERGGPAHTGTAAGDGAARRRALRSARWIPRPLMTPRP